MSTESLLLLPLILSMVKRRRYKKDDSGVRVWPKECTNSCLTNDIIHEYEKMAAIPTAGTCTEVGTQSPEHAKIC